MLQLFAAAHLALTAPTGSIYGDIRLGDKYLSDLSVSLKCGTTTTDGKTDDAGSFRLTVPRGGKCQLSVTYEKQTAEIDVVVFEKPAQYRLVLELKDGKYTLRRI
jgi:hypothetical protein